LSWERVLESANAADSVLKFEKNYRCNFPVIENLLLKKETIF